MRIVKRSYFPVGLSFCLLFKERRNIKKWLRNSLFTSSSFTALWVINMLFWVHSVIAINLALIYHPTAPTIASSLYKCLKAQDRNPKILEKCQLAFCRAAIYCTYNASGKYRSMGLTNHGQQFLGHWMLTGANTANT